MDKIVEFGSLFTGGGGLDMGLEAAGMKCSWQVENDKHCITVLEKRFPDIRRNQVGPCDGLVGGDPCPIRSVANRVSRSSSPDLSGYFLAMVARCEPKWVLRENVCAPDVVEFQEGLAVLGYRSVIIRANSAAFTGQSRLREFVVGFDRKETLDRFVGKCAECKGDPGDSASGDSSQGGRVWTPLPCLTTRRHRMDTRDVYVYEGAIRGIRVLSHKERERLQGWPGGWTEGIPSTARERIVGNGVTAPVAQWIGERILEAIGKD